MIGGIHNLELKVVCPNEAGGVNKQLVDGRYVLEGSLPDLWTRWLADLEVRGYARQTIQTYQNHLQPFDKWTHLHNILFPFDLTLEELEQYRLEVFNHRRKDGTPLKVNSQIARLGTIKRFCAWMVRKGFLDRDPSLQLELPRKQHRCLPKGLSRQMVRRLLEVPDTKTPVGIRNRAILELFYTTGIRRFELVQVNMNDMDLEQYLLRIEHGKGGNNRIVPVGRHAIRWVEDYLRLSRPMMVRNKDEPALFITNEGNRLNTQYLGNVVRHMMDKVGVPKEGACHLLRHACATHMLEGGADIRIIQHMLGHVRLDTTEIYTHVGIKTLQEAHLRSHPSW